MRFDFTPPECGKLFVSIMLFYHPERGGSFVSIMGIQRGDLSDLRGIPEENERQRRSCGEFQRKMSVF